jgi:ribonuclease VapC
MILDTSAVLAVAFREPSAARVLDEVSRAGQVMMSTVNLAETLIVFRERKPDTFAELFNELLDSGVQFIAPDRAQAELAASARHRFPLNFGDCFAYALAKTQNAPLLTLDSDFRATDIPVIVP